MTADITVKECIREIERRLAVSGVSDSAAGSRLLFCHVSGIELGVLPLEQSRPLGEVLNEEERAELEDLVARRCKGEPLQYIVGSADFLGYTFLVDERVLIPRQDTESMVMDAVAFIKKNGSVRVLDLCTGSGAIGLSIAMECPEARVTLSDISGEALSCARENAEALSRARDNAEALGSTAACGIENRELQAAGTAAPAAQRSLLGRIEFVESDLLAAFAHPAEPGMQQGEAAAFAHPAEPGMQQGSDAHMQQGEEAAAQAALFDVIITNPPYIPDGVISGLQREIREHEPMLALSGGSDGLDIYRRLAEEVPSHIGAGGALFMEIGDDQAAAVLEIFAGKGLETDDDSVRQDLSGRDRYIVLYRR